MIAKKYATGDTMPHNAALCRRLLHGACMVCFTVLPKTPVFDTMPHYAALCRRARHGVRGTLCGEGEGIYIYSPPVGIVIPRGSRHGDSMPKGSAWCSARGGRV